MFKIDHISKSYAGKSVLSDISFDVHKGDCIGILGANGSGKSTLSGILAGALKPSSGSVFLNEVDLLKNRTQFVRSIGYVPQKNPLIEDLSVLDNLRLYYSPLSFSLKEDLKNGPPALLGVTDNLKKQVRHLSGGMQKRLSIVCALAGRPQILILDEPGAALDLAAKDDIRIWLNDYLTNGGTILITTHDEADFALCNRLLLIHQAEALFLREEDPGRWRTSYPDHPLTNQERHLIMSHIREHQ